MKQKITVIAMRTAPREIAWFVMASLPAQSQSQHSFGGMLLKFYPIPNSLDGNRK
jgi:hypothetical protein